MAVPKRKMSRANTRTRRSAWKADLDDLQTVKVAGRQMTMPRRFAKAAKLGLYEPRDEYQG
ncbi:50S ribosomal protein L32 [Nanchangia anserum]|uniref:Large ribosomal subunit protein bL32 n=1 Tax=Nanchangia anserum TaxID=2692125 RepID=A0A8I0G6V0_9ACTO|nr:50S ribosomal protein L32 [Nanchangia anserum]MBD3688877.1 50S ribosomal protein L32 [Nanchangia anserum]QOX81144.1 50S ribosomal protein L32 [Nanchangia anserum]